MDSMLKLVLMFSVIAGIEALAIWLYRWPQRKMAKAIAEAQENDPLRYH